MSRKSRPADPLRRGLLAGLASVAGSAALASAPLQSIRPAARLPDLRRRADVAVERLIARSGVTGSLGYAVRDADTGELIEARNPDLALPPASSIKAVTALYALESLGPAWRFRTRVLGTGPVEGGVLRGDLVLKGGGDPVLDTPALATLVEQLRGLGLTGISGRFLVDDTALPHMPVIDPEQPEHVGYNPALSGLNLNFNRVFFEWQRGPGGYSVSMDARAGRLRPEVGVTRMRVIDRDGPVYTYSGQGDAENWTVSSRALGEGGGRWLPVRRPGLYAGDVLRALAATAGLALPEPEPGAAPATGAAVLALTASDDLPVILADMLRYSTNLTAEVVGLSASAARGAAHATLADSAGAMSDWIAARHGAGGAALTDHSGLGGGARITAPALSQVLASAGWDGPLHPLLREVRFRDENGTPVPNHPVSAAAKTGTLNFVSALAGYAQMRGRRRLAFAILGADLERRAAVPPEARERPLGARPWAVRSRRLQQRLVERWAAAYS